MKSLSHVALVAAHSRGDWPALWQEAASTVRLVVARMARNGTIRAEDQEDMEQEGTLIAGEAVRTWRPIECALSTYVGNQVRWKLTECAGRERNHGIGSHEQRAAVLSLEDTREVREEHASGKDDEEVDDATFASCLTYEGVLRRTTGQFDGMGYVPEGFGDPADEADRQTREAVIRSALAKLPESERVTVCAVYGFGERPVSPIDFAERSGMSLRTVERRLMNARNALAEILANSRHRKYGRKECS